VEKWQYILIAVFWLLLFTPFILRDGLTGYDSYAFVNATCQETYEHDPAKPNTAFANVLFEILPCNMLVFKLLLLLLGLSSLLICCKTGELLDSTHGWLAGVFLFLSPLFVQHFVKFENDQFGTPFIFASFYFLLKAKLSRKNYYRNLGTAFILLIIAALFWNSAGLVIIGASLEFVVIFFASLPIIYYYGKNLFESVASNPVILENTPGLSFIVVFLLNYGFFAAPMPALTIFMGLVAFLNGKYAILLLPLLSFGLINIFKDKFYSKFRNLFIGWAIGIGLATAILGVMIFPPTIDQWNAVDEAIELHESTGKPIKNLFQYGYMLDYRGYVAENYGFYEPGYLMDTNGYIVITFEDINCMKSNEIEPWVYVC